jgi:CubicO group peptidase (beta-lactamase class C family)
MGVAFVAASRGDPPPAITATTPVDELPWQTYRAAGSAFVADLPGRPARLTDATPDGTRQRFEVDLPGATIAVSVVSSRTVPNAQTAYLAAARRAEELGARLTDQRQTPVLWGTAWDGSLGGDGVVGAIRASVRANTIYVVDVRAANDATRARSLFDRVATSFRPAAGV